MDSSLESIKVAIGGLPDSERAALAVWLNLADVDEWDKQMHTDFSPGGRGHALVGRVRAAVREGTARQMPSSVATDAPR